MNKINRINFFIENKDNFKENNQSDIDKVLNALNNDRLIILNGMMHSGRKDFIKQLINSSKVNNSYFYLNKQTDKYNIIDSGEELIKQLNNYIQLYKKPEIIILEESEKIEGIKQFISKIYKEGYKIILIGNNIKIGGIKEFEILNNPSNNNSDPYYGRIKEIEEINSNHLKEKYIKLITNDIFTNEIFKNFGVKSIELYNNTMTYLAEHNLSYSLRDLQKNLNINNKISLKTTIDYIDFSIQSKIIKRVYRFDIKNNKEISSKAKYYFNDTGIKNNLAGFKLNSKILLENYIFNILEYNNFELYSGLNGKFEFSFYGIKGNQQIYIHISEVQNKEELKKEINKLLKIGTEGKKYLLVESTEILGIKKLKYDSVEIITIQEFIEKLTK